METPSMVLLALTVTSSTFSVLGSAFVLTRCYRARRELPHGQKLIAYLSTADLCFALCTAMSQAGPVVGGWGCQLQAVGIQFFGLCSIAWSVLIGFNTYCWACRGKSAAQLQAYEWRYLTFSLGVPFCLTAFPWAWDAYGAAGVWCWLRPADGLGAVPWRWATFYGPLLLAWLADGAFFWLVARRARHFARVVRPITEKFGRDCPTQVAAFAFNQYVLAFVFIWFWGLLDRIYDLIPYDEPHVAAVTMALHAGLVPLQGLLNALIYSGAFTHLARLCGRRHRRVAPELPEGCPELDLLQGAPPTVRIFAGTWNTGGGAVPPNLTEWLPADCDIYAIGLQECKDVGAMEAALHGAVGGGGRRHRCYGHSIGEAETALGLCGCLAVLVFVPEEWVARGWVAPVGDKKDVKRGRKVAAARAANKGCVGLPLRLFDATMAFVATHLHADSHGTGKAEHRLEDCREIYRALKMEVEAVPFEFASLYHHICWLGDLNFRVQLDLPKAMPLIDAGLRSGDWERLAQFDELTKLRGANELLAGFQELPLTFPPTYKRTAAQPPPPISPLLALRRGSSLPSSPALPFYTFPAEGPPGDLPRPVSPALPANPLVVPRTSPLQPVGLDVSGVTNSASSRASSLSVASSDSLTAVASERRLSAAQLYTTVMPSKDGTTLSTRVPSWTDRVLWKSLPGTEDRLTASAYTACERIEGSDHVPVSLILSLDVDRRVAVCAINQVEAENRLWQISLLGLEAVDEDGQPLDLGPLCLLFPLPSADLHGGMAEKMLRLRHLLQVHRLAVQILGSIAAAGRPSSSGSVSRWDLVATKAHCAAMQSTRMFPNDTHLAHSCVALFACLALDDQCQDVLMKPDALDFILEMLNNFLQSKEVVLECLGCLRSLSTVPSRCPTLLSQGLVGACLTAASEHPLCLAVSAAAQLCLWNLAAEAEVARFLVQHGALSITVAAMKKFSAEPSLLSPALGTLHNVARLDELRPSVMEARGLKHVLDGLHRFPTDGSVVLNALGALTMLAKTPQFRAKLLAAGLGTVVFAMAQQMDDAEAQLLFAGLLLVLTSEVCLELPYMLKVIPRAEASALGLICDLLRRHPHQRALQHTGLAILLHMAVAPEFLPVVQRLALDQILFAARTYADDVPITGKCNHLLALLAKDEGVLKGLLKAGALLDLIRSMKQYATTSSQLLGGACHLITVLAINGDTRNQLVEQSVAEMVLHGMQQFPEDVHFLTEAAAALWCLAHEASGKQHIFDANGMRILKACMDAWPRNMVLWRNCNGVLRSLITEDQYTAAFLDMFGADLHDEPDYSVRPATCPPVLVT